MDEKKKKYEVKPAGDEHMGKFVYCKSHVSPHSTGWCTVDADNKISLKAQTREEAFAEARTMGLTIYGENTSPQKPDDN